jgi:hypothetical protein
MKAIRTIADKDKFHIAHVVRRPAVHYAPSGEWGGEHVNCGRYYTTDVLWTRNISKVTCRRCLKQ